MSKFSGTQQHHSNESARNRSGGNQYDLLPLDKKCETFFVTFDFYSPRAHFIIAPRRMFPAPENYNALDHTTRLRIVAAAKAMVSHYGLEKSAILSVHLGSWMTKNDRFHVHVCVDLDDYLRLFETKKEEIPGWPSRKYVTREWRASQDPNHYEINVRGYPFKTYFKQELADIRNTQPQHLSSTGALAVAPPLCILYHPSEPKVGFAVEEPKKSNTDEFLLKVQEAIINFATTSNLTNIHTKDGHSGCHMCLILDGKAHG